MAKNWQLATTGILLTVSLVSNVMITPQYKIDQEQMETRISNQKELIKYGKYDSLQQDLIINDLNKSIEEQSSEIHNLEQQLEQATNDCECPSCKLTDAPLFEVSFYTSGYESTQKKQGDIGFGITASGTLATEGRTVAAPSSIPFGTKLYIEGIGIRVVEDRGGAIENGHLDVYVQSVGEALQLGRKTLKVVIIE